MATTIVLKNSVTTTNTPSSLAQGEVAINVTDKKVWVGNAATTPVQIVNGGPDGVFTSVTDSGLTNTRLTYAGAGGLLKDSASITTDGTTITAAFSGAHNGTVGATTPASGSFTSINGTGQLVVTGARTQLIAGSESYALSVRYKSGDGQFYIGATDAASPDMLFCNNVGSEVARFTNSGNLNVGGATSSALRIYARGQTSDSNSFPLYLENSATSLMFYVRGDGYINTGLATNSPYNATSGGSANMFVYSDGGIYRATSSLKYKTNVVDSPYGLADVLKLRAVNYEGIGKSDLGKTYGGMIAEEVDAAGLKEFVQYAEDGTPDALAYGHMVSLAFKAIQELNAKVDAQAAEIAALKAGK